MELTVDTTVDFVSAGEVFEPGICNYEAHPYFKSLSLSLTSSMHYQLFPLPS